MTFPDLSFIETARALEVEAVEGGRALNEFTLDPERGGNDEELRVLGRSVDDVEETGERARAMQEYVGIARSAFQQRGLTYPFTPASGGNSLEVLPGQRELATRVASLSSIVSQGLPVAKDFEKRAFRALQALMGGWGVCVGSPRGDGSGAEQGIKRFRSLLEPWETGPEWPATFAASGDHGADGFIVLGRGWGGPVVFFQSKNTSFSLKSFQEEFARMSESFHDWFGKRLNELRRIVPVCALNTVFTIDLKERAARARGEYATHLIDAVDILRTESGTGADRLGRSDCTIF